MRRLKSAGAALGTRPLTRGCTSRRRRRKCAAGACVALVLASGCASRELTRDEALADRAAQHRVSRVASTADAIAESEGVRPARLARDLRDAGAYFEGQAADLELAGEGLADWITRDARRPQERLAPTASALLDALLGKPDRIPENAVELFY